MKKKVMSLGFAACALAAATAVSTAANAAVITQYNFGASQATNETVPQYQVPTTVAANLSAGNLTFGSQTTPSVNNGPAVSGYYTSPGPNYLSVQNTLAADDSAFYVDFVVTAASGFTITPTGFTITGGAGGSSGATGSTNVRSFLLFDAKDGLPTSITPTSSSPTVVGGAVLASGAFSNIRSTSKAMNSFTANFPSTDAGVSSFDVRVYFDTQLNGQQKNIDLGSLTLTGTVDPTPEPASLSLCIAATVGMLGRRRRVEQSRSF